MSDDEANADNDLCLSRNEWSLVFSFQVTLSFECQFLCKMHRDVSLSFAQCIAVCHFVQSWISGRSYCIRLTFVKRAKSGPSQVTQTGAQNLVTVVNMVLCKRVGPMRVLIRFDIWKRELCQFVTLCKPVGPRDGAIIACIGFDICQVKGVISAPAFLSVHSVWAWVAQTGAQRESWQSLPILSINKVNKDFDFYTFLHLWCEKSYNAYALWARVTQSGAQNESGERPMGMTKQYGHYGQHGFGKSWHFPVWPSFTAKTLANIS